MRRRRSSGTRKNYAIPAPAFITVSEKWLRALRESPGMDGIYLDPAVPPLTALQKGSANNMYSFVQCMRQPTAEPCPYVAKVIVLKRDDDRHTAAWQHEVDMAQLASLRGIGPHVRGPALTCVGIRKRTKVHVHVGFLVMERLEGTLGELVHAGEATTEDAHEILALLQRLHGTMMTEHLDLNMRNVMFKINDKTRRRLWYLIDFLKARFIQVQPTASRTRPVLMEGFLPVHRPVWDARSPVANWLLSMNVLPADPEAFYRTLYPSPPPPIQ